MESPETSKQKCREGETKRLKLNSTPTTCGVKSEEFSTYYLHKESSPNFSTGQDVLEVGWGDSPEPINLEKKSALNKTPVTCKKRLESKESPRSSIPSFKRRNIRSTLRIPSNTVIDIAKYVAEVQELSKNIMKELNGNIMEREVNENNITVNNNELVKSDEISSEKPMKECHTKETLELNLENFIEQSKDSTFDNVLQSFINEEDDWLSQALSSQESGKHSSKISFVKYKSDNELSLTQPSKVEGKNLQINCRNINHFRRTSSFDMTKSQGNSSGLANKVVLGKSSKSLTERKDVFSKIPAVQYSQQEIEKKRLEAIYRRERREIERKKLEAMRRLEMKKIRPIKT